MKQIKEILIGLFVLIIIAVVIFFMVKRDNFDITTTPLYDTTSYEILQNTEACPPRPNVKNNVQYNGLNPQYNDHITLQDYINTYSNPEEFDQPGGCDVVARRYCNQLYGTHREYFNDRWSGLGECELDVLGQCERLKPLSPKKVYFDL